MANHTFDLVVIGGGPGGYVAAIRAAQLGLKVACVERDKLGGTCLNWGCIPTKALLANAELYHQITHNAEAWGISAPDVTFDFAKIVGRSRNVAGNLNKGVGFLFKKNKITHLDGHAFIPAAGKVQVYDASDTQRKGAVKETITCKNIVIATGAGPRPLPGADFDGSTIISSKEAMTLTDQPKKLLIIGAGAIGMEFAYFYNAFGTECTIVEMQDRLLPIEDDDVSRAIAKAYKKIGVTTKLGHVTQSIEKTNVGGKPGIKATVAPLGADGKPDASKAEVIEADKVLVAIGVMGRFDGLFADSLGIEIVKGHLKTDYVPGEPDQDPTYETTVKGIYAIGDVIGPPWLAHVASEEGVACVEKIVGHEVAPIDYHSVPGCTYCHPQVASIGFTERVLKERGLKKDTDYTTGTFPFQASGKAQAVGETAGFVKVIAGKEHGEILGVHMIGENVTELIAEWCLAKRLESTAEEVIATMHAHPTLAEASHEAALDTQGRMIHS